MTPKSMKKRWKSYPQRVWKLCLRKCCTKCRKSEPKGSKIDPKIHPKSSPRGAIKGEIRNTIWKWLPGCPKSFKMSPNWSQKSAIWGPKGSENQSKFVQKVTHLALIPVCGLLLHALPNFPRCLTDAAQIRISTWERAKRSGAKRSEAALTYVV